MQNYVEDKDAEFRFGYSHEFLRWALMVPDYKQMWHIGVRAIKNNKLVAFISGTPVTVIVEEEEIKMAEINFLCVHKKLRTKKLAPLLIQEITRRVNLKKIWKAVYTTGVVIPTPFTTATYLHRNLNVKKLVDAGFAALP